MTEKIKQTIPDAGPGFILMMLGAAPVGANLGIINRHTSVASTEQGVEVALDWMREAASKSSYKETDDNGKEVTQYKPMPAISLTKVEWVSGQCRTTGLNPRLNSSQSRMQDKLREQWFARIPSHHPDAVRLALRDKYQAAVLACTQAVKADFPKVTSKKLMDFFESLPSGLKRVMLASQRVGYTHRVRMLEAEPLIRAKEFIKMHPQVAAAEIAKALVVRPSDKWRYDSEDAAVAMQKLMG